MPRAKCRAGLCTPWCKLTPLVRGRLWNLRYPRMGVACREVADKLCRRPELSLIQAPVNIARDGKAFMN